MTFAEIFVFLAAAALLYFLMKPLQRKLESYLRKLFKSRGHGARTVIDITDYSKKDKNK